MNFTLIISFVSMDFAAAFLTEIQTLIEAIRALGFVLGMGGATTALFLFLRFLRDLDINEKELQTLKEISELIWLGLASIFVSQFASFVVHAEVLALSGPFLAQMIALFVVAISGAVLMIIFAPFLAMIPLDQREKNYRHSPLESLRRPLFITGAVALSSWYFAFFMNFMPIYKLTVLLLAYIAVLVTAVATVLLWGKRISRSRF